MLRRFKQQPQYPAPLSRKIFALIPSRDLGAVCLFNLRQASIGKFFAQSTLSTIVLRGGVRQKGDTGVSFASVCGPQQVNRPLLGFINLSITDGTLSSDRRLVSWIGGASPNACYLVVKTTGLIDLYWNNTLSCTSTIAVDDGLPHTIAVAGQINDQRLYIDGVLAASGTVAANVGWVGGSASGTGLKVDYQSAFTTPLLSVSTGGYFHNWNPRLAREISEDVYHIFEVPSHRVFATPSGITTHNLSADNATQTNIANSPTISQTHVIFIGESTQANISSDAALTQVSDITVSDLVQSSVVASVSLIQIHKLSIQSVAQSNVSQADNITQVHALLAPAIAQSNIAVETAVSQSGDLAVDDNIQTNIGSAGQIAQTHVLSVPSITQAQSVTSPSISQGEVYNLATASLSQGNAVSEKAIGQTHDIAVSDVVQLNVSPNIAVTHSHTLVTVGITQTNISPSGVIAKGVLLVTAPVVQNNAVEAVEAVQEHVLAVSGITQGNLASASAISTSHDLAVGSVTQLNVSPDRGVSLTQILIIASATQDNAVTNGAVVARDGPILVVDPNYIAQAYFKNYTARYGD